MSVMDRPPIEFANSIIEQARMFEAERRALNAYVEQFQAGLREVREKQIELRTVDSAAPALARKVQEQQKRIADLEGLVRRIAGMSAWERLAWLVWGR